MLKMLNAKLLFKKITLTLNTICIYTVCKYYDLYLLLSYLPLLLKYFEEYFPDRATDAGIVPRSSMICARWSEMETLLSFFVLFIINII